MIAAAEDWPPLWTLLRRRHDPATAWQGQLGAVRRWYEPHLERLYDAPHIRGGDLEHPERIAGAYPSRELLAELTLTTRRPRFYAPRTRFIPDAILDRFERRTHVREHAVDAACSTAARVDVGARLRAMWS